MVGVAALLAAAVIGGAPSAPEVEPTACWKALFEDWADGRVSGTYSVGCYRRAIGELSGDRLMYGSAAADLRRLLDRTVARLPTAERDAVAADTLVTPFPASRNAAAVAPAWKKDDAWRIALAAVLTALLVAWVVARVRRT